MSVWLGILLLSTIKRGRHQTGSQVASMRYLLLITRHASKLQITCDAGGFPTLTVALYLKHFMASKFESPHPFELLIVSPCVRSVQ